jgi:hypothetical protein
MEMKNSRRKIHRSFKKGDRVEILRKDISWGTRKKQRFGYVTSVNGAYHYVRPLYWREGEVLELYDVEIRHAPLKKG